VTTSRASGLELGGWLALRLAKTCCATQTLAPADVHLHSYCPDDTVVVAESDEGGAVNRAVETSSKSMSELLARILEQLAISAWLPAAALTLITMFVLELGAVLGGSVRSAHSDRLPSGPGEALSQTFEVLGRTSIGALLLLLIVIVVLTMLTQAFSFEWIRLLEGYWGVSRPMERLAQARSRRWRNSRKRLERRYEALTKRAWSAAKPRIAKLEGFTPDMVAALGAQVRGKLPKRLVTPEQQDIIDDTAWLDYAPGDLLRRRVNLDKKLADFPRGKHTLPTRLGNVLRHFEDETNFGRVETMIDEVFDSLPASLRVSHDEQRSRLDLYCSMQIALVAGGLIAILRFGWHHRCYSAAAIGVVFVGIWIFYRAAVASARYYGSLLVTIAQFVRRRDEDDAKALAASSGAGPASESTSETAARTAGTEENVREISEGDQTGWDDDADGRNAAPNPDSAGDSV